MEKIHCQMDILEKDYFGLQETIQQQTFLPKTASKTWQDLPFKNPVWTIRKIRIQIRSDKTTNLDTTPVIPHLEKTDVVVVYHVTIVAIGHGLLKKFWPFGNRLRSTHCREFRSETEV